MTGELTPKQQRFVEEYIIDLNGTQAAIRAGYDLRVCGDEPGYYVYLLSDSISGQIFYVGKGKKRRYAAHVREWQARRTVNAKKSSRIGEVIEAGGSVIAYCFASGMTEREAFDLERRTIAAIGRERLTNATPGQVGTMDRAIYDAQTALKRIKPFCEWLTERPRTREDQRMYWDVIGGYHLIATGEWAKTIERVSDRVAV